MRHLLSPPASCRWKPASAFHVRKKALRLSLLRTLAWPRASPDECSLSGQAFAVALVQARFKRLDFVIVTSGFFCLGSRLLGILVIGFDVLGHDFAFFLLKFTLGFYWKILFFR